MATSVSSTNRNSLFLSPKPFPPKREFRHWKRRRFKPKPNLKFSTLKNQLEPPSTSPFDFLSHLPSNWIPPAALGFASALALSLTTRNPNSRPPNPNPNPKPLDIGEWILFSTPTPFNRFVFLRCPSIEFEGAEFLEDVNEKLVKEERHYVRLDSGRIEVRDKEERDNEREIGSESEVEHQRVCVGVKDGGVVALDWPANLDLNEEVGLDTTVLLVPGTVEGSMDRDVRGFVCECLKRGLFPVVMNPRGCAGSPLTTPRLFTAADSDDICSAIEFITRARPYSTLTGVGWGYGANMLTKYLAEAGEKTPLTAATCIDNPFDLDEATRTTPYSASIDKKLTRGLIDILKSNKELFQGRRKGFDVEKALSATSVRDFEKAVSMVSYGFETIEEFYSHCSTRSVVGKLKIPVLFIQNDDGTVPLFSVPRVLIAENPFTSLLLCSCLPSNVTASSWYQQVTIEWLAAVELALLKGRHPLLQDMDVSINPSKGLALVEGRTADTGGRLDSVLNLAELDSSNAYVNSMREMLQGSDSAVSIDVNSNQVSHGKLNPNDLDQIETNGAFPHASSVDADSAKDVGNEPVLQTAQVVMNMLDVTMPGALKEKEKRKVLEAVGQGETLIKALQDAVPEDVRGKLTTSVSEILQARGKNLKLDGLLSIDQIANVSSGLRSNIKANVSKNPDVKTENVDHPSDQKVSGKEQRDISENNQTDGDKIAEEVTGSQTEGNSAKALDHVESKSANRHGDDIGLAKSPNESQSSDDKVDSSNLSAKKVGQNSDFGEEVSETTPTMSSSSQNAGGTGSTEAGITQNNTPQDDQTNQLDLKDSNVTVREESHQDLSNDQSKTSPPADTRPADTSEAPMSQLSEKGGDESKSKDERPAQPPPEQNRVFDNKTPSFSVSQALDALSGLDDSTQLAVNSVFGVIEDMITQLEEKKHESTVKKVSESNNTIDRSVTEKTASGTKVQLEKQHNGDDQEGTSSGDMESVNGNYTDGNKENDQTILAGKISRNLDINKLATRNAEKPSIAEKLYFYRTSPYTESFYHECLRKYILSKVQEMKPLYLDTTSALFLDYNPEEGNWLLAEQPRDAQSPTSNSSIHRMGHASQLSKDNVVDNIIEPSYVILDSDKHEEQAEESEIKERRNVNHDSNELDVSNISVKTVVLNSLKVEVGRRISATDMENMETGLAADMEEVAEAVYMAVQHEKGCNQHLQCSGFEYDVQEHSRLHGNHIIEAISQAVQKTSYLKRILPVGVVVGSSLAALRNFFDMAAVHDKTDASALDIDQDYINRLKPNDQLPQEAIQLPTDRIDHEPISQNSEKEEGTIISNSPMESHGEKDQLRTLNRDTLMVGAVTAAIGASALLTSQQEDLMGSSSSEISSSSESKKEMKKGSVSLEEPQSNIVTSLAEKAMSVAAPVVPTKEDGEVDHERIVAMLAELGQKGGMLKLVGKLALLWGGLRGAMSLTDRLISFLRVAERPLLHRVLGFFCMVLVLWSPVLVPLLPTLFHNWATHNSSRIAELACILGLYAAVTILIMQWGKRIRGHEYPLKQYGLDFMSSRKIQDFFTGLVGGVILVLCIQSVNAFLGFVNFSLPPNLSSPSLDLTAKIKAHAQLFLLASQGIVTAASVAFVEELLFRSWLLEEIAADLGYHPGIFLSGLAFALSQRSLLAIPGLWLLSMSLAGARLRKQGSLFIPIGMRTGIMASSYLLHIGGFLIYQPKLHSWVAGTHPLQPFAGLVGIAVALLLTVVLYPRQHGLKTQISQTIQT